MARKTQERKRRGIGFLIPDIIKNLTMLHQDRSRGSRNYVDKDKNQGAHRNSNY